MKCEEIRNDEVSQTHITDSLGRPHKVLTNLTLMKRVSVRLTPLVAMGAFPGGIIMALRRAAGQRKTRPGESAGRSSGRGLYDAANN